MTILFYAGLLTLTLDAVNMVMFARYDYEVEEQVGESAFGRVLGPPVIGWR